MLALATPRMLASTTISRAAPAKVNLCLRIVGRRTDGYHLLDSIFAAIDLSDRVTVAVAPGTEATEDSSVTVSCNYPGVPNDETNLAARAVRAFLAATNERAHVRVSIDKRIPPGAGLGGGSSNAATVLATLNDLCDTPLAPTQLAELALTLGADVPFFLTGGCARVRGIGEHIEPIHGWPGQELVVAIPPITVSTAWAFGRYRGAMDRVPVDAERLAASPTIAPALLQNDLETVVLPAHPEIAATKQALIDAGASAAVMSGSGSAVLALCPPALPPRLVRDAFAIACPRVPAYAVRVTPPAARSSVDHSTANA